MDVCDGWDGWSGNFFFKFTSRKLLTIFANRFRILLEYVSRYFLRKTQKIKKKLDFSKIFAKIGGWFFFRFFEHKFANFSKTSWYFFLIVFAPLRRLFKTSFVKKSKKIKIFNFVKKFQTKRVYFTKKVLEISLYFDWFWRFRFFEHWFVNFSETTWDYFLIVRIFRWVFGKSFVQNSKKN